MQKLRIVPDPMIHYALLRFCQHTRLTFLARNVPPAILMHPVDVNFDPASVVRTSPVTVPVFIQDLIVSAILQRGLGATYDTLPAHILSWCRTIVRSRGLGRRIHGSVEDTKLSTNKQHSLSNCHITREASALLLCPLLAWQLFTAQLLTWCLGWLRSRTPLNGLPARLLTTPPLGPARHFRHSNSCTTTC